eukprot:m.45044 g.45044  ORF g.45044 m.45044 type:complete len:315 (+) comp10179_c0_seq1:424-1368(+)
MIEGQTQTVQYKTCVCSMVPNVIFWIVTCVSTMSLIVEGIYFNPDEVVITNMYAGEIKEAYVMSGDNHKEYARRHGYRYYASRDGDNDAPDVRSGPQWKKLYFLRNLLARFRNIDQKKTEWVLWVDLDAVFTNMSKSLDDLVAPHLEVARVSFSDIDFFFNGDTNIIITAAMLLRNSEFVMNMLDITIAMNERGLHVTNNDNGIIAAYLNGCDSSSVTQAELSECYERADLGWGNDEIHHAIRRGDRTIYKKMASDHAYRHAFQLPQREFLEAFSVAGDNVKNCHFLCHCGSQQKKPARVIKMLRDLKKIATDL